MSTFTLNYFDRRIRSIMELAIAGLALMFSLQEALGQCGSASMQTTATGTGQQQAAPGFPPLNGIGCTNYMTLTFTATFDCSAPRAWCCGNSGSVDEKWNYKATETDQYSLPPPNQCGAISTYTASSSSGKLTYDWPSPCPEDYTHAEVDWDSGLQEWIYHGATIYDPGLLHDGDPTGHPLWTTYYWWDPGHLLQIAHMFPPPLSPDTPWPHTTFTATSSIYQENVIGTGIVDEELSTPVDKPAQDAADALAIANIPNPTVFINGDPVSSNAEDSHCATAKRTKWRIKVTGTIPGKTYIITYVQEEVDASGKTNRIVVPLTRKAKNQDPWYIDSEGGKVLEPSAWPSGCTGGTDTIKLSLKDFKLSTQ